MGFKSYCWHIGNTSFRVKQLAYKNELQLEQLLKLEEENPNFVWKGNKDIQAKYYKLAADVGLVKGSASNKPKDAREITAPLVNLGLIDDNRKLSEVGRKIHEISSEHDFKPDNVLERNKDSYLYLLQFLKMQIADNEIKIKPFLSFLYCLIKCEYLTKDEFAYLLPMCLNSGDVVSLAAKIRLSNHNIDIDKTIIEKIFTMSNYQEALDSLLKTKGPITEQFAAKIGMNRKSSENGKKMYDAPIAHLYNECLFIFENMQMFDNDTFIDNIKKVKDLIEKVGDNQKTAWKKFFNFDRKNKITKDFIPIFREAPIFSVSSLDKFKETFFKSWHLFKVKNTLDDYYDLNKRYFSLCDMFRFAEERFTLIDLGNIYFSDIIDEMLYRNFLAKNEYKTNYPKIIPIEQIDPACIKTGENIANIINERFNQRITANQLEDYFRETENRSLLRFVDDNFSKQTILHLLDCFKNRNDEEIMQLVSDEATISTSFEYIIAIIWYRISGRSGYLKEYMNLSLRPDYRPKSHAPGGKPDLLFKYNKNTDYPSHNLIIEVTLSESTTQREMEELSVKRHLESNIVETHNLKDYAIFIAGELDNRIIQGFRAYKHYSYMDGKIERSGLNIVPIDIEVLKHIVENDVEYRKIFKISNESYESQNEGLSWHNNEVKTKLFNC